MSEWIEQFGYLALFIGALIEGEIVLISGIIAAKNDLLQLWPVPLLVFIGALSIDWFWFMFGRSKGMKWLTNRRGLASKKEFIENTFRKYPDRILLSYRFLIGFRTIVPLFAGISNIHLRSWAAYSFISALIWTVFYSVLGYLCEAVLLKSLESAQNQISKVFLVLLAVGLVIGMFRLWRQRVLPLFKP